MSRAVWGTLCHWLGLRPKVVDEYTPEWKQHGYVPPPIELEPEPPPSPRNEPLPPPPGDAAERAESLIRELPAAATALRVLALFPEEGLPWDWLEELTAARHPVVARLPLRGHKFRDRLVQSGLVVTRTDLPVARVSRVLAAAWAGDPEDEEALKTRTTARCLVLRRIPEIKAEQDRRRWRQQIRYKWIRKATHSEFGQTEIYTPAEPEDTSRDDEYLSDYGLWQKPYLRAYIRDELLSGAPERMEWALLTNGAGGADLEGVRAQIERGYAAKPDGLQELRLRCLLLFNDGRIALNRNAYTRGGWYPINEAVEILEKARERYPGDPELEQLWEEGWRLFKLYDW